MTPELRADSSNPVDVAVADLTTALHALVNAPRGAWAHPDLLARVQALTVDLALLGSDIKHVEGTRWDESELELGKRVYRYIWRTQVHSLGEPTRAEALALLDMLSARGWAWDIAVDRDLPEQRE